MTALNYSRCLKLVLKHEGGYVDHPRDPGGATNKGITIGTLSAFLGRKATKEEVRNISDQTVAMIYKSRYWDKVHGDELPDGMDYVAFDGGVNSGPSRGVKWLQRGLGVAADGRMGPVTLGKAGSARDGVAAIQRACAARLSFLRGLRNWSVFGRGWGRRVAEVEAVSVGMYSKSSEAVASEAVKADRAKAKTVQGAVGTGAGGVAAPEAATLPDVAVWGIYAVAGVVVLILALKAVQHARRAAAYRKVSEDMANG